MPTQPTDPQRMLSFRTTLTHAFRDAAGDQRGATAIEYALIASGIGAAVAGTVWSLGSTTAAFYQSLAAMF